jgi:tetratricopeptide (TPR) repeat protein
VEPTLGINRTRQALLIAGAAVAVLLGFEAGRNWLADHRLQSGRLHLMQRGVALEPGNAEAWDQLGRVQQFDLASLDPSQAVQDYLHAVRDDPYSAHYWMDLAGGYEDAGEAVHAGDAFEQARKVYPSSAEVAWNYGNFLLRQGEFERGYAQIHRAVESDASLLPLAISRTWRSDHDVRKLMEQVLPADLDAYFQALDFFAANQQGEEALKVWPYVIALGKPFPLKRSFPFLDELIREDRAPEASRIWRDATTRAGIPYQERADGSLVWNGDFGHDFANGGLGWRWNPAISVAIDFDAAPPGRSGRALKLDFGGGANIELLEPMQMVAVEPNRIYHFHALLRTEGITTESGMSFGLDDPNHPGAVQVRTENLTGTNPWTPAEADFGTGSQTHFVALRLVRPQSRLFDNKLSGTAWIADVSVVPSDQSARQGPK